MSIAVERDPADEAFEAAPRAAARGDQSGFELLLVGRSVVRKTHAFALSKTFCRSHNLIAKICRAAGQQAGRVYNRTQKTAVNPLTRHASRSEMRANYHSLQVEGPAAIQIHRQTGLQVKPHGRRDAFQRGISGLAPQRQALPKKRSSDAPLERPCQ